MVNNVLDILARYFNVFLLFPIYFYMELLNVKNIKEFLKDHSFFLILFYIFNFCILANSKIELNFFIYNFVFVLFFIFFGLSIYEKIKNKKENFSLLFFLVVIAESVFIFYFFFDYLRINRIYFLGSALYYIMLFFIRFTSIILFLISISYLISKIKFFYKSYKKFYILLIFVLPIVFAKYYISFYEKIFVYLYQQNVIFSYNKIKDNEKNIIHYNDNVDIFLYKSYIGYIYKKNEKISNAEYNLKFKNINFIKMSKIERMKEKLLCIESFDKNYTRISSKFWIKTDYFNNNYENVSNYYVHSDGCLD